MTKVAISKGKKVHKKTQQSKVISMACHHGIKCLLKMIKKIKIHLIRKQVRKLKELKEMTSGKESKRESKRGREGEKCPKSQKSEDYEEKVICYLQALKVTNPIPSFPLLDHLLCPYLPLHLPPMNL